MILPQSRVDFSWRLAATSLRCSPTLSTGSSTTTGLVCWLSPTPLHMHLASPGRGHNNIVTSTSFRQRRATSIQTCLSPVTKAATFDFMYTNAMEALDAKSGVDNSTDDLDAMDTVHEHTKADKKSDIGESKTDLKAMAGLVPRPFTSKAS